MEFFEVFRWVGFLYLALLGVGAIIGDIVTAMEDQRDRSTSSQQFPLSAERLEGPPNMLAAFSNER